MLVHFPAALFPLALACSLAGFETGDRSFAATSFYAGAGGALLGWAAVVFGALELPKVFEENPKAVNQALVHAGINVCVIIFFTVTTYAQLKTYPAIEPDGKALIGLKAGAICLMMFGNYFGGNLVLKFGIAVRKPKK